jgi:hypothetical protein
MIAVAVLVVCALSLGSCASTPPQPPVAQQPAVVQPPSQPTPPPQPVEAPTQPVQQQATQPQPVEQPKPAPPPAPNMAQPYAVTKEVYTRTFDEIRTVIDELNTHIAKREYDRWLEHLTPEYVNQTSRPEYLDKWKEDAELKRRGIVLKTLRDFFDYRVVPTRSNVKLDEIQFLDDTHVYAFTVLKGEKYLLYYLVKTDKGWKVDFY